jgi:hypothetical protein
MRLAVLVATFLLPAVVRAAAQEPAPRITMLPPPLADGSVSLEQSAGAVVVGAFDDDDVLRALGAPRALVPLYLIPVGQPRR